MGIFGWKWIVELWNSRLVWVGTDFKAYPIKSGGLHQKLDGNSGKFMGTRKLAPKIKENKGKQGGLYWKIKGKKENKEICTINKGK